MGIDQHTGELVVVAARADLDSIGADALTARLAAVVPVRLRSIDAPGLDPIPIVRSTPHHGAS